MKLKYEASNIRAERKKLKQRIAASPQKETTMKKKTTTPKTTEAAADKQPRAIKLSTIWKVTVYAFAIIGVVLSIVYINDTVSSYIDTRAEAKAAELVKAAELKDPSKQ